MRILLVRLSAIGDCIHALPLVGALRDQLPEAEIDWAISPAPARLLAGLAEIDRFLLVPRRPNWRQLREVVTRLREHRYDVAIDVQGLTKSGVVARLSGARQRIGFRGPESRELNRLFVNQRVRPDPDLLHVVDRNLSLLHALELTPPSQPRFPLPAFEAPPEIAAHLEVLHRRGRVAVLNPGTTWATKAWPAASFAELAGALIERGYAISVTWGTPAERRLAEQIANATRHQDAHLAPPSDLRELASLLQGADLVVSNDSGPLHLADALGVTTVGIFGPTDGARNGPYRGTVAKLEPMLQCQPCWKGSCSRGDLACLTRLDPATVLARCPL